MDSLYRKFFVARAFSTLGDAAWLTVVPLYFAHVGYSPSQIGAYSSLFSLGTVIGFVLLPFFAKKMKFSSMAVLADVVQVSLFFVVFLALSLSVLSFAVWVILALFLSCAEAIWFGSSESLISNTVSRDLSQGTHRLNFFSENIGLFVGPLIASTIFIKSGLMPIVLFNVCTFLVQIFVLNKISQFEKPIEPSKVESRLNFKSLLNHPVYFPMFVLTSVVKVSLVGALPFVAYIAGLSKVEDWHLYLCVSGFPLGSVSGAYFYRESEEKFLAKKFLIDSLLMLAFTFFLILAIGYKDLGWMAFAVLGAGFFSSKYTIEIRAMRQMITSSHDMPKLVSLRGSFPAWLLLFRVLFTVFF